MVSTGLALRMLEPRHLRTLLLGLAVCLAGVFAWRMSAPPPAPALLTKRYERAIAPAPAPELIAAERRTISDNLAGIREFGPFVRRLSAAYPTDWDRLLDGFAIRALNARVVGTPEAYISDALKALRRDRGIVASRADVTGLGRVFDAQAQMLAGLAGADTRLCVDFMLGQTSPAFLAFGARHRDLLAALAGATLDAMIAGDNAGPAPDAPTDADFDAVEAALVQRGLGKPEIGALLDGRWPDPPIPDARMCDAGLIYFDALKHLPDDARRRIYALAIKSMGRS